MANRVEDNNRRYIFDVIKISTFGIKYPRILVVERPDISRPGRVCFCNDAGKVKRALEVNQVKGAEEAPPGSVLPEDVGRSVLFRYFESAGRETCRVLLFVSARTREAFLDELTRLDARLVTRRRDGSLASTNDKKAKVEEARRAGQAAAAAISDTGTPTGARPEAAAADDTGDSNYFCMEENDWGFLEPRVLTFSDDGKDLHVVDATQDSHASVDVPLRRVSSVRVHASDSTVLCVHTHDGALLTPTPARSFVLTFGNRAARDRFVQELRTNMAACEGARPLDVDDKWSAALPTRLFVRFEAVRTRPKKFPCALLLSPRMRRVTVVPVSGIKGYEAGGVIPAVAAVDCVIGIVPGRIQLERHPRNPRLLSISEQGATVAPTSREVSHEFEFMDGAERERFCAYVRQFATDDTGPVKTSLPSAGIAPAPRTLRTGFRAPCTVDTASLYSQLWPHDDVRTFVGTYNVSGTPPPSDLKLLDTWVPAPLRDPEGPRDLYVFGFQECGASSNRDAWAAALAQHLSPTTAKAAGATSMIPDADVSYLLVDQVYMWEMALWIFVRAPHVVDVVNVSHADLPTGLEVAKAITGVQLGNKGAVGVSLRWRDTTFAFVMCHLPARPDLIRLRKREHDYKLITRKFRLDTALAGYGMDFVHQHDHVWFFGDLNYRVDLPYDRVVTLYKMQQFGAIVAHDQLLREQARGRVFLGFQEAHIDFPPTYRWLRNVEEFSWKRGQSPSYTDRILHRSLPGLADRITQTSYTSGTFVYGSDHRPVAATYRVSLRRYYCAPTAPISYPPLPLPTFFSAVDSHVMPVPVIVLTNVKFTGVPAMTAPAGVFITLHAPWLSSGSIQSGIMSAMGISTTQKDELRTLRGELAAEKRKDNARLKAEAKEAKARAKQQKKEMKARGEKDGPRVTVQGDAAYASPGGRPTSVSAYRSGVKSMSLSATEMTELTRPSLAAGETAVLDEKLMAEEHDSDDDDDAEDEMSVTGREAEYTILDEDAVYAASAAAAALEGSTDGNERRRALVALQAEYAFVPSDSALPPLRPACWDPRILRQAHLHVVAHASPGIDGSFLAIGGGKTAETVAGASGSDVVGQATISLAPVVRAACHAVELAYAMQHDDDASSVTSHTEEDGGGTAERRASTWKQYRSGGRRMRSFAFPQPPGVAEQERLAAAGALLECSPAQFARGFTPEGTPWALTSPAVNVTVNMELSGQVVGKLSAQVALRASTDAAIAVRLAGGARKVPCAWDFSAALAMYTQDYTVRHGTAVTPADVLYAAASSRESSASSRPTISRETSASSIPVPPRPAIEVSDAPPAAAADVSSATSDAAAKGRAASGSDVAAPTDVGVTATGKASKPKAPSQLVNRSMTATSVGGTVASAAAAIATAGPTAPTIAPSPAKLPPAPPVTNAAAPPPPPITTPTAKKKAKAPAALLQSRRVSLAPPIAAPEGSDTAATPVDDGGANAAIMRRGSVMIAPQYQAFFEAQFARKLRLSLEGEQTGPDGESAPGSVPGAADTATDLTGIAENDSDGDSDEDGSTPTPSGPAPGKVQAAAASDDIRARITSMADRIAAAIAAARERSATGSSVEMSSGDVALASPLMPALEMGGDISLSPAVSVTTGAAASGTPPTRMLAPALGIPAGSSKPAAPKSLLTRAGSSSLLETGRPMRGASDASIGSGGWSPSLPTIPSAPASRSTSIVTGVPGAPASRSPSVVADVSGAPSGATPPTMPMSPKSPLGRVLAQDGGASPVWFGSGARVSDTGLPPPPPSPN